jgi:hypothetical protein
MHGADYVSEEFAACTKESEEAGDVLQFREI